MQERRLMLLNRDRRAEALAELEAQDVEKERERELAENARRRQAATGIFLCLLELKRPVEAAEAAGVRLGMCETEEERRQVNNKGRVSAIISPRELGASICMCFFLTQIYTAFKADWGACDTRKKLGVFITTSTRIMPSQHENIKVKSTPNTLSFAT